MADGEEEEEDEQRLDVLGGLGRGEPLEEQHKDLVDEGRQRWARQRLDHRLQQVEALVVVGLGRHQLLEDAEQGFQFSRRHHLLAARGHEGLQEPHQRLDVGRPLPQNRRQ